ncbi:hypothetical protein ACFV0T_26305 [Streptomyces sp. NPDC059582]|uniref:hypothetical protein n=1 Tax=Streptomyces sp. NPDC059582 TaxID=3346875 RepID=UPI003692C79F
MSDVASAVATIVQRLPQTLQQLEAGLQALSDDQRIRLADRHPSEVSAQDIFDAVHTAAYGLRNAREALGRVEDHLRSATGVLGTLGAPWEEADEAP